MTSLGRNDPCHCGSGKKYKKCCLKKDQAAERAEQKAKQIARPVASSSPPDDLSEAASPVPETLDEPPDPHMEAINARWDELQAADYEGQIALFYKTLEEDPELMDGEMAFEFLNPIYYESIERNERDRFEKMADDLRERLPEMYAAEAGLILGWRITNALANGRFEDVPALANDMARNAEKNIDEFFNLMDQLAYHNQLATLIEATRIAWPQVKDSTKIFGIDEFANQATDYLVYDYLTHTSDPDGRDPTLLDQIEPYMDLDLDRFADYVAGLAGQRQSTWTMADFEFKPLKSKRFSGRDKKKDNDEGRRNLYYLTLEFLHYLYHQEDVPYAKGELARTEIYRYILRRHDGDLAPQEPLLRPRRGDKKRKSAARRSHHPLCPDRGTLDRFLGELLHLFNPQYYKATTTLELVPAWLRFLESRHLIDAEQREQTLSELWGLDTEFLKVVENHSDPALRRAMEDWRSDTE